MIISDSVKKYYESMNIVWSFKLKKYGSSTPMGLTDQFYF